MIFYLRIAMIEVFESNLTIPESLRIAGVRVLINFLCRTVPLMPVIPQLSARVLPPRLSRPPYRPPIIQILLSLNPIAPHSPPCMQYLSRPKPCIRETQGPISREWCVEARAQLPVLLLGSPKCHRRNRSRSPCSFSVEKGWAVFTPNRSYYLPLA